MSEADMIIESLKNSGRKVEEFYTGNKTSDINVSSIEEDIEILNSIVKVNKDFLSDIENQTINQKEIKALEHLLSDYTRQKQINEEHKNLNGELREKVKELKEENKELMSEYHNRIQEKIELEQDLKILEQKIKDKIEELKEDKESKYYYSFLEERDIEKTIDILQELLQESEDK